jgi:hypothetical protein
MLFKSQVEFLNEFFSILNHSGSELTVARDSKFDSIPIIFLYSIQPGKLESISAH